MKNINNLDIGTIKFGIYEIIDSILIILITIHINDIENNDKLCELLFTDFIESLNNSDLNKLNKSINTFINKSNSLLNSNSIYKINIIILLTDLLNKLYNMLSATNLDNIINNKFYTLGKTDGFYIFVDKNTKEPITNKNELTYNQELLKQINNIVKDVLIEILKKYST